jgi:Domain of unknown function (DUF5069)
MASAIGTKVVPLVSSSTAGPLGAVHLPRLWAKLTLYSAGVLADGYDFAGAGFDQMTIDDLGLDRQKVIDYVKNERPTYTQFEQWVVAQNGGSISPETIKKHNDAIFGYHHSDELAKTMRDSSGISNATIADAVTLNMLEDLDELRAQTLAR